MYNKEEKLNKNDIDIKERKKSTLQRTATDLRDFNFAVIAMIAMCMYLLFSKLWLKYYGGFF